MIAILRQRNFLLLWSGGLISVIGDWVLNVGLPIYIFLLTRSILITSITLLAGSIPSIVLGTVAGVFVDRWDRKRTMIITNVLLAVGLLPLLLVSSSHEVWIVYIVAFVESCIAQFFVPASSALLPTLVGEEHLMSANGLNSLSNNIARLIGPAFGGLIAGLFGLNGMVLIDAASFIISGTLIACIVVTSSISKPLPTKEASLATAEIGAFARVWKEWKSGLKVIFSERTLTVVFATLAIIGLGEGVMNTLFPVFVYRVLHGTAPQIGELLSAQAAGGLLGGLLVGWMGKRLMAPWVVGVSTVLFGLIDLAIFNSPSFFPIFWLSVGLFVAVGVPSIAGQTGIFSLVQAKTPDAYRGRVFGALGATMGLLTLIGTVIAGTITNYLGVVTVLNLQGSSYVLGGLLLILLLPNLKKPEITEEE